MGDLTLGDILGIDDFSDVEKVKTRLGELWDWGMDGLREEFDG